MVEIKVKKIKTIVIGEDEAPLAKALTFKFEDRGYSVFVANNGEEVINYLDSHGADALLLDLIMPKMSGFDVLEHLKETKNDITVFVSSNLGQETDQEKIKSYNVKGFFVKADSGLNEIVDSVDAELKK